MLSQPKNFSISDHDNYYYYYLNIMLKVVDSEAAATYTHTK